MKILHVYKTFYPDTQGGVEHFIQTLSRHTARLGCENQLVTLSKNAENKIIANATIKIIRFPITFALQSCPLSYALLREYKFHARQADLIHYHFPWPTADLMHLLACSKQPAIVTYHSDIVKQRYLKILYSPLCNWFLKQMRYLVATSPNYLASSPNLRRWHAKTQVIPVGIDQQDYLPVNANALHDWSAKFGSDFFLFVGVLRYYKGLHTLLEAMQTIERPLLIAGTGPCEQALKAQAARLNLTNVFFIGFITDQDKSALLQLCRAVIFPSHLRSEAFGITLVEGLLFGKPLVSCEIATGTSFVNQHNQTGLVIPPENPRALRSALQRLSSDDQLVAQLEQAAQQRYIEFFTAEKMAAAYVELYKKILVEKLNIT